MKFLKSFLAVILVANVLIQSAAMAASSPKIEKEQIEILNNSGINVVLYEDSKERTIIETIDNENGIKSIAEYDKVNNILLMQTGENEPIVINLNEIEMNAQQNDSTMGILATQAEYTFSNYEYIIYLSSSPRIWELRRPQPDNFNSYYYKYVTETTYNQTNLNKFKTEVDNIYDLELTFIAQSIGVSITVALVVILTAVTMGGAANAGLVALGLTGAALQTALDLERACKNAHYYYFLV